MNHPKKESTTKRTMNMALREVFDYGGIPATRVEIWSDLRAKGVPERCIEMYLFTLEQHKEAK